MSRDSIDKQMKGKLKSMLSDIQYRIHQIYYYMKLILKYDEQK